MHTTDTVTGNKLMNGFMGYSTDKEDDFYLFDLSYHNNWNLLMGVVERIENLGYRVYMERGGGIVYYTKIKERGIVISDCDTFSNQTRIQATWLCIIQFIQWYNTTQSKK